MTQTTNILDYLNWRGDLTFTASPFNEVDNLILSMLSFIDYSDSVKASPSEMPRKLSSCLDDNRMKYPAGERFGQIVPDDINALFYNAARSKRFKDAYAMACQSFIDEKTPTQFAAITFILPDDTAFISFRGTDDTLAGWQEDFRLSYDYPVKAQIMAAEYADDIAATYRGNIILGGHSKGGNLALYAAAFSSPQTKSRVIKAYSNDGPGFPKETIDSPEFREAETKMLTILPQSSSVGLLMHQPKNIEIISSVNKSGLKQHDPFSWTVLGNKFIHLPALSPAGKKHEEMFAKWIDSLSLERRKTFTETLFGILDSIGAKTVSDLNYDQIPKLVSAAKAVMTLNKEDRDLLSDFLRGILEVLLE